MNDEVEIRQNKKAYRYDAFLNGVFIGTIKSVQVTRHDRNSKYKILGSPVEFDDLDEAASFLAERVKE